MRKKKDLIHYLPEFGCISTGVLYAGIGMIALLSFFKVRDGGADESSMLLVLNDSTLGKILIGLIITGTTCYVAWRIYEAVADPYDYGTSWRGIGKRAGIALSTIADAMVISAGVRVFLGLGEIQTDGQPLEERAMTKAMLDAGNDWLVVLIGTIIFTTALVQLIYGFTKGYKERVDEHDFSPNAQKVFHALGLYGYGARGLILGIVGFFFIKAGWQHDSEVVVNTDKAFDFIGDHVGHALFIVTAIGTIAYGFFMFALGVTYKAERLS
jgi:hypothetical protein